MNLSKKSYEAMGTASYNISRSLFLLSLLKVCQSRLIILYQYCYSKKDVLNRTTLIILYCVLHDPCNIVCVCPVNNVYV
jgi:hypothetical protein